MPYEPHQLPKVASLIYLLGGLILLMPPWRLLLGGATLKRKSWNLLQGYAVEVLRMLLLFTVRLNLQQAKRKIVRELVDRKFVGDDLSAANAVLRFSAKCEEKRNQIAHHTWGFFHDQSIDGVILVDPRDWTYQSVFDTSKAYVWSLSDFEELKQDMYDLKQSYEMLRSLGDPDGHDIYYATIVGKPKIRQYIK